MLQSLRVRIALAYGLGGLALVLLMSWAAGVMATTNALRDQGDTLQTLARSTAALLADGLDERLREVQWLAAGPPREGWSAVLDQLRRGRPHYSWIGIAGSDGRVQQASGGLLLGQSVAERPWFQAGLRGPHVGDVHTARLLAALLPPAADGEPLRFIDFAAPLHGADGSVQGVLGVHATWAWAQEVIDTMHSPLARESGVEVFIADRAGALILRPRAAAHARSVPLAALPRAGAASVAWDDGVLYLSAAWRLPARSAPADLGWSIVVRQPVQQALAAARLAQQRALLLGAAAALLAALLAWKLAGRFSRPLQQIAAAAQAVQSGRLETPIPRPGGARELQELGAALQGMTQSLLQREHELERRVEARTQELQQATAALAAANAELQQLATRDALTGLMNRRAGDARLRQEFSRHRRSGRVLALALADIDHFKRVNDTHGHAAGDAVLQAVAACLAQQVRSSDALMRWGGEEFLVLMPETEADGARVACEKLRAAVAALGGAVPVTLSLGVATLQPRYGSIEAALQAADEALYEAKAQGRDRVVLAALAPAAEPVAYGDTAVGDL